MYRIWNFLMVFALSNGTMLIQNSNWPYKLQTLTLTGQLLIQIQSYPNLFENNIWNRLTHFVFGNQTQNRLHWNLHTQFTGIDQIKSKRTESNENHLTLFSSLIFTAFEKDIRPCPKPDTCNGGFFEISHRAIDPAIFTEKHRISPLQCRKSNSNYRRNW